MIFGVDDNGVPTNKREELLIAILTLQNARLFVREARDALLGNDDDLRQELWQIHEDISECIEDVQRQYKKKRENK